MGKKAASGTADAVMLDAGSIVTVRGEAARCGAGREKEGADVDGVERSYHHKK